MSKFNNEEYESEIPRGYAAYEPIPDSVEPEDVDEYIKSKYKLDERRIRKQLRRDFLIRKYSNRRFYRFLLIPIGQLYDPGFGEVQVSTLPELFNSRAYFLLKTRFLQSSFGFYRVEYSIVNNYAISHYSLNNGLTFKKHFEVELRGSMHENIESIAELIAATESFLRKTIKEKTPPYLMNMK